MKATIRRKFHLSKLEKLKTMNDSEKKLIDRLSKKEEKKEIHFQLKISNLDHYLDMMSSQYRNKFDILGELEETVIYNELINPTIMINYKDDGIAIFLLESYDAFNKCLVYTFNTTAS